ncbi:MAG: hypothetical protein IJU69_00990 [Bacteroidales bacterium]|nr:hypothetical protein [Bacteroidales bacterium]
MKTQKLYPAIAVILFAAAACATNPDIPVPTPSEESDAKYVGKAVGNFTAEEWYPGGELGTTLNVTEGCYEDEAPAVTSQGLTEQFNHGEMFFERNFTLNTPPFKGLGPAAVRKSCLDCHPGYGHGKWQSVYEANTSRAFGNGYLLVVYYANEPGSNDGAYVSEVTGMPQTMAVEPFLPPIDEKGITISWIPVTAMESGLPMTFPDGEKYTLQYPELTIARSAFNTNPNPYDTAEEKGLTMGFRLESTIGVIGSGLIDAIPEDAIREQYRAEAPYVELNPSFWDKGANDFAAGAYYGNWQAGKNGDGILADGTVVKRGEYKPIKRFTYAMTRGTLQDGAGANAIWNITNVTRPDRPFLYTTVAWARKMSETPSVIAAIRAEGENSPYYVDVDKNGTVTDEEIAEAVFALLSPSTNQFDNPYHNFQAEMGGDDFYDFMVWHRGLSIPRARNLQSEKVQKGKTLFNKIGCASCHRPSWKTGDDNYWSPAMNEGKPLPRYANQTIWPYSDFIQHRLYMKNDIHGSWCRTTPLWGRGLSSVNTGASDRLHDCRAKNVVEAIMWHAYSKQSDGYASAEKFYQLSKEERDAVVSFVEAL